MISFSETAHKFSLPELGEVLSNMKPLQLPIFIHSQTNKSCYQTVRAA